MNLRRIGTPAILLSILLLIPGVWAAGEQRTPAGTAGGNDTASENRLFHIFPPQPALAGYTSESRSTVTRFELQMVNKSPPQYPWTESFSQRVLVDIQLGLDIPLFGGENDRWKWYAGLPVSFEILNDFFEPTTAPVVNTNYWFGTRMEVLYRLGPDVIWPRNIALRILPVFHESTHIGDETALWMAANDPSNYYRINLSYEAWEIALGIDEWENRGENSFNVRLGLSGKWNSDGYYNIPQDEELGSALLSSHVIPSRLGMEYFGQFNAVVTSGFPAIGLWVFQWGTEARNRILLDYFSGAPENRIWTITSTLGWYRYPDGAAGRRVGFYLRFQGGQNPHGQFREQGGYFVFGTGFSLGI